MSEERIKITQREFLALPREEAFRKHLSGAYVYDPQPDTIENAHVIITEIERLNIGPDEVLAVHLPPECNDMSDAQFLAVKNEAKKLFESVGIIKVVVVRAGASMQVVTQSET